MIWSKDSNREHREYKTETSSLSWVCAEYSFIPTKEPESIEDLNAVLEKQRNGFVIGISASKIGQREIWQITNKVSSDCRWQLIPVIRIPLWYSFVILKHSHAFAWISLKYLNSTNLLLKWHSTSLTQHYKRREITKRLWCLPRFYRHVSGPLIYCASAPKDRTNRQGSERKRPGDKGDTVSLFV
jgi:hypothetical protein